MPLFSVRMGPCRGTEVGGIIQTKKKSIMRWKKTSKIFKFTLQKPDNFPFVITEERACEIVAWVIKFLLNLSKERFCLVSMNHRIYGGKMIYINREAA